MAKVVDFMCTAFRDGFQSCYGARVLNKDFFPALEAARAAGIRWFEHGGGAIFQSKVFYCNEDPYTAMDEVRDLCGPDINLQTLARGVNVVALDSQSSDFVRMHAQMFKKHGVTTVRNFDALNDVENLIFSGKCIVEAGLKHQVVVTLMGLPPGLTGAHDPDFYEMILRRILDAGIPFDSVCFKDASGTLPPQYVFETIKRARKLLGDDAYIDFHSHCTGGTCMTSYMAAIEAGTNAVDLSLAPVSEGTSQPDVLTMWHNLRHSDYTLDVDIDKVREAESIFKECMDSYFLPPESGMVEPLIPWSPMPGGALTSNTQMLRDNKLLHRYEDCIRAMSECVAKGGFGTSVTPVSQFYFQQAFNNVMFGPWKKIAPGYGKMVLGYFGHTPVPSDPEIVKIAAEQLGLEPTDRPVLEINDADPKKSVAHVRSILEAENLPVTDENLFLVASCQEKGISFLKGEAKVGIRKKEAATPATATGAAATAGNAVTVNLGGTSYAVTMQGGKVTVNGATYDYTVGEGVAAPAASAASAAPAAPVAPVVPTGTPENLVAPLPGIVLRIVAAPGTQLAAGDVVLVLEAMKMEMEIKTSRAGTLASINVKQGDQVEAEAVLAVLQ